MITRKEKIAIKIIFNRYKKNKDPNLLCIETKELIDNSDGQLSLSDLQGLILHGNSKYLNFLDVPGYRVIIKPEGIAYMEDSCKRIINSTFFYIFGISSVIAGIYAVLTYYFK